MDRCPVCRSNETRISDEDGSGAYAIMECLDCGHEAEEDQFWPTRAELGLDPDYCEACNRRLSWGCGHSHEQEIEALEHRQSEEHQSGACWHYDHTDCDSSTCTRAGMTVPGYAPFVKHTAVH
jgi:hypothetical protein